MLRSVCVYSSAELLNLIYREVKVIWMDKTLTLQPARKKQISNVPKQRKRRNQSKKELGQKMAVFLSVKHAPTMSKQRRPKRMLKTGMSTS